MKRKRIGKAVLSLTLVVAMCLPFTAGHRGRLVAAASTVWSGGAAAEYAGGQGTQEDPLPQGNNWLCWYRRTPRQRLGSITS